MTTIKYDFRPAEVSAFCRIARVSLMPLAFALVNQALSRVHVLLVEDDELVARGLARWLRRGGYDTTLARTGSRALALTEEFDAGIFDIDLPDANGVDVAQRLLDAGVVKVVLFFSATEDEATQRRAEVLGKFFPKAAGAHELLAGLASVLPRDERSAIAVGAGDQDGPSASSPPPSDVRRRD